MNYWRVKQEPEAYLWSDSLRDGGTAWTGVHSFPARKNLRIMKANDRVLFYHRGNEKSLIGPMHVFREFYLDPTAEEDDWSTGDLAPVKTLARSMTLVLIKGDKIPKEMAPVRPGRLSVRPVATEQFTRLPALAESKV